MSIYFILLFYYDVCLLNNSDPLQSHPILQQTRTDYTMPGAVHSNTPNQQNIVPLVSQDLTTTNYSGLGRLFTIKSDIGDELSQLLILLALDDGPQQPAEDTEPPTQGTTHTAIAFDIEFKYSLSDPLLFENIAGYIYWNNFKTSSALLYNKAEYLYSVDCLCFTEFLTCQPCVQSSEIGDLYRAALLHFLSFNKFKNKIPSALLDSVFSDGQLNQYKVYCFLDTATLERLDFIFSSLVNFKKVEVQTSDMLTDTESKLHEASDGVYTLKSEIKPTTPKQRNTNSSKKTELKKKPAMFDSRGLYGADTLNDPRISSVVQCDYGDSEYLTDEEIYMIELNAVPFDHQLTNSDSEYLSDDCDSTDEAHQPKRRRDFSKLRKSVQGSSRRRKRRDNTLFEKKSTPHTELAGSDSVCDSTLAVEGVSGVLSSIDFDGPCFDNNQLFFLGYDPKDSFSYLDNSNAFTRVFLQWARDILSVDSLCYFRELTTNPQLNTIPESKSKVKKTKSKLSLLYALTLDDISIDYHAQHAVCFDYLQTCGYTAAGYKKLKPLGFHAIACRRANTLRLNKTRVFKKALKLRNKWLVTSKPPLPSANVYVCRHAIT